MADTDPATSVKAERLREAREYFGFSQDDVAGAIKREQGWVDDIENGRQRVTGEELRKLSRLYRRPVAWLCGETTFQPGPELLRQVEHLDEGDREAMLDFAEFLEGAGPAPQPERERRQR
jgi:transcriptional regulator with XRE-family HTH domain